MTTSLLTQVTSQSLTPPVDLQAAKEKLGILHNDQDTEVQTALDAAIEYVESVTGRALRPSQAITASFRVFPCTVEFNRQPVASITSVQYYASGDTALTTLDAANYLLHTSTNLGGVLHWADGFSPPSLAYRADAVQINYVAGYGTDAPPAQAKVAILLRLEQIFGDLSDRDMGPSVRALTSTLQDLAWNRYR